MAAKMSGKLWRLGMKNAFIVTLFMFAVCLILAGVIGFFTPRSWSNSLGLAFVLFFTAAVLMTFVNSVRGRVRAGSLLLDAGAHPMRWFFSNHRTSRLCDRDKRPYKLTLLLERRLLCTVLGFYALCFLHLCCLLPVHVVRTLANPRKRYLGILGSASVGENSLLHLDGGRQPPR